jgi:serine/threonine-protein kinase
MNPRRVLPFVLAISLAAPAAAAPPPRFPAGSVWHTDNSAATPHVDSGAMIGVLDGLGGWGPAGGVNHRFHIDFSIVVNVADGLFPPRVPIAEHLDYGDYYLPDCEPLGTRFPLPGGAIFEDDGNGDPLRCDNENNDCHLIVVYRGVLHEVYSGDRNPANVDALCLAQWDLTKVYPAQGRGDHCTSADAAGFPIAPLMPNADEVAAAAGVANGDLGHAIRFILPNLRMASLPDADADGDREPLYVRPATHAGGPSGPETTVPYGSRLRLRGDFPMAGYNAAALVLLRTMQRYGIVLSDGGNIALTFASDANTTAKWAGLGVTPQVFWNGAVGNRQPVRVTDFTVLDTGPRIVETYDCVRTAVAVQGFEVFYDGIE